MVALSETGFKAQSVSWQEPDSIFRLVLFVRISKELFKMVWARLREPIRESTGPPVSSRKEPFLSCRPKGQGEKMITRTQETVAMESATFQELRDVMATCQGLSQRISTMVSLSTHPQICQFLPIANPNQKPGEKGAVSVVFRARLPRAQSRV